MQIASGGEKRPFMRIVQHFLAVTAALFAALAAAAVLGVGPTAADPIGTPATLHGAHVGATNPGFSTGTCPSSASGSWGWHFVLPDDDTTFVSISATFLHEGIVTSFISQPTGKHAYVYTHQADTLLGATAMVDGSETSFNLSHVCAGVDETPPSTTVPSTTVPSTTAPSTTVPSTTAPSTTAPSTTAPSTSSAPTTVTEQSDPSVTVLGVVETAPQAAAPTQLAFTGAHTVFTLLLGAALMAVGALLTAASRRRVLFPS
jgi:hypothetical protein